MRLHIVFWFRHQPQNEFPVFSEQIVSASSNTQMLGGSSCCSPWCGNESTASWRTCSNMFKLKHFSFFFHLLSGQRWQIQTQTKNSYKYNLIWFDMTVCVYPTHLSSSHPGAPGMLWRVFACLCVPVSICPVSVLPLHFTFTWFYTWWYSVSLCEFCVFPSVHSVCFLVTSSNQATPRCCLSLCVLIRTCVSPSVHRGGNVWNGVAGEVLQLQQEGPLPVGKQLQQHRVRMQTQRHAHTHVGQQGDVCLMVEQLEIFPLQIHTVWRV